MKWKIALSIVLSLFFLFGGLMGYFVLGNRQDEDFMAVSGTIELAEMWYYPYESQPRFPGRVGKDPSQHVWIKLAGKEGFYIVSTLNTDDKMIKSRVHTGDLATIYYSRLSDDPKEGNPVAQLIVNDNVLYSIERNNQEDKVIAVVFFIISGVALLYPLNTLRKKIFR